MDHVTLNYQRRFRSSIHVSGDSRHTSVFHTAKDTQGVLICLFKHCVSWLQPEMAERRQTRREAFTHASNCRRQFNVKKRKTIHGLMMASVPDSLLGASELHHLVRRFSIVLDADQTRTLLQE